TIILSLTEILNSFKAFSNFKPPLLTKGNFPFTFNGISILYFVPALSNLLFSEYTWPAIINRFAFSLVSIKFFFTNYLFNISFFILLFFIFFFFIFYFIFFLFLFIILYF